MVHLKMKRKENLGLWILIWPMADNFWNVNYGFSDGGGGNTFLSQYFSI